MGIAQNAEVPGIFNTRHVNGLSLRTCRGDVEVADDEAVNRISIGSSSRVQLDAEFVYGGVRGGAHWLNGARTLRLRQVGLGNLANLFIIGVVGRDGCGEAISVASILHRSALSDPKGPP